MRRRNLLGALAVTGAKWPVAAAAQQPTRNPVRRVGFLYPGGGEVLRSRLQAFREGLYGSAGQAGPKIEILTRVAAGEFNRLPALAAELVADGVDIILAVSPPAVRAALDAAPAIPIVAHDLETDPVASGWAASLGRPGRNVTGVFLDLPDVSLKCLQLLREALPGKKLGLTWDPAVGSVPLEAIRAAGGRTEIMAVGSLDELDATLHALSQAQVSGVALLSSPIVGTNPTRVAEAALAHRMPAITLFSEFAQKGGLLSYGPDLPGMYRQAGAITRKVLLGTSVSEFPIERPTRFRLVVNLKTAKALGLDIAPSLLARADEVID